MFLTRLLKKTTQLIFLSILIGGCSINNFSNKIAPGYVEAYQSIKQALFGYDQAQIDPNLIYKIPYASSIVRIGNGPNGLLILESKNKDNEIWVSKDNIYLNLKRGRIVATNGLINNLSNGIYPKSINDITKVNNDITFKYYFSFDKPKLTNLEIKAKFTKIGFEEVDLFDRKEKLLRIDENIQNSTIGWNAINKYWIDKEGFIWKSEQNVSPKLPKIYIEIRLCL